MGRMYFRHGAMGSSKSAHVLITKYNYEERGIKVTLFKPATDTRDGQTIVKSRIGLSSEATVVPADANLYEMYKTNPVGAVIVDESQFLASNQVDQLRRIVDEFDIPVFCYGLRTDFQSHLFEGSKRLMELTDEIEEIKTVCTCGRKALINARLVDGKPTLDGDQIMLGGNESYVAMCHKCWSKAVRKEWYI